MKLEPFLLDQWLQDRGISHVWPSTKGPLEARFAAVRVTIRAAGRAFFDARSIRGGILTQVHSGWCRMRPIKAHQIGNVG